MPIKAKTPIVQSVNQGDHAFTKVQFDMQSTEWFSRHLSQVTDPETRAHIWRYFWLLVLDHKLSSLQYLDLIQE